MRDKIARSNAFRLAKEAENTKAGKLIALCTPGVKGLASTVDASVNGPSRRKVAECISSGESATNTAAEHPVQAPCAPMTPNESKSLKKGSLLYWQGDPADAGVVTEMSWDAVTITWSNGTSPGCSAEICARFTKRR